MKLERVAKRLVEVAEVRVALDAVSEVKAAEIAERRLEKKLVVVAEVMDALVEKRLVEVAEVKVAFVVFTPGRLRLVTDKLVIVAFVRVAEEDVRKEVEALSKEALVETRLVEVASVSVAEVRLAVPFRIVALERLVFPVTERLVDVADVKVA